VTRATRAGTTMVTKSAAAIATVAVAAALVACSSGSPARPSTPNVPSTTPATAGPTTTSPESKSATEAAVLGAWESAEQTLYAYLQAPWQQDRANLVAGETSADLWPKLADYFADPALQSEDEFLVGVKMGQLNGPTTYNLGHPAVATLTATTAVITGCIYDTGTTTAAGPPGPATLDGGAGGGNGTWSLQLLDGSWKITVFKTTSVPRC